MRLKLVTLSMLALVAIPSFPAGIDSRLREDVERIITAPPFDRAIWGIVVEEEGSRLYARNSETLMVPASVRKLFTAAAVLACESPAERLPTEILVTGPVVAGVLEGDLIVRGHGDPSFGGRYYERRDDLLEPLAVALAARGAQRISGRVVADGSAFDDQLRLGDWQEQDRGKSYAPPVSAIAWNENVAGVFTLARCPDVFVTTDPSFVPERVNARCGSGRLEVEIEAGNVATIEGRIEPAPAGGVRIDLPAVPDPALYAAQAVVDFLERRGIAVDGGPSARTSGELPAGDARLIATLWSPDLLLILATMLEESSNLYAETLFKRISLGGGEPAGWAASLAIEEEWLVSLGLDSSSYRFRDGSGLATENLVTPDAVSRLLRHIVRSERIGLWDEILAEPGEGTLRRRLNDLDVEVRAKTGGLTGVAGLAGYVRMPSGRIRTFVILVNHFAVGVRAASQTIDRIVERLAAE